MNYQPSSTVRQMDNINNVLSECIHVGAGQTTLSLSPLQSLDDLLKTLLDLSDEHTTIIMSYEERTTGNKPEIEKRFFQVGSVY